MNRKNDDMPDRRRILPVAPREGWAEASVPLIYAVVVFFIALAGIYYSPVYSSESLYRTAAANDLLNGLSRGRQALVGSIIVAPLPTVILSIAAAFPLLAADRAVFVAVAAGSALLMCWHVNGLWKSEGIHPAVRAAGGVAILSLPPVALSIQSGRSTMIFVALTVSGLSFLLKWVAEGRLRSIAYAGVLLGLALTVRYQGLLIAAGASMIVVFSVLFKKREKGLMQGTVFIFATPVVYMILLWLGGNWLILGNPLFLLRGILRSIKLGRTGVAGLIGAGCEWNVFFLVAVTAIVPMAAGLLLRKKAGPALKSCALALTVALAATAVFAFPAWSDVADINGEKVETKRVIDQLEKTYRNTSFIVTGYRGYEFTEIAGNDEEDVWIHVMHLEQTKLDKILADFRGRNIFLLVHSEEFYDGWVNLGIEWVEPWTEIPEQFMLAKRTGPWLVFEVFSAEVEEEQVTEKNQRSSMTRRNP